ncbi:hypothetical protein MCOR12_004143 [Pyricularia oryzae]|nr:hypothetical protein MCOR12_004143 [Pyricularia oryzae]
MRNAKTAARVWQSETRIYSKLMATTAGARFIVQLLGTDARIYTIYMEDVEGPSLAHPTWRQRPENLFTGSRGVAGRIMRDIALALDYVHSKGITHYDVKPGNILYNDTRGAVLIDFGLSSDSPDTATNIYAAGTPWYIPPEFLAASNPGRGFPGDVWALGVVQLFLFKLLPLPETTAEWIISHVRALDRIQTFYYTQPAAEKEKHTVTANVMRYKATGTDETTTVWTNLSTK